MLAHVGLQVAGPNRGEADVSEPTVPSLWRALHVLTMAGATEAKRIALRQARGPQGLGPARTALSAETRHAVWQRASSAGALAELPLHPAQRIVTEDLQIADFVAQAAPDLAAMLDGYVALAPLWRRGSALRVERTGLGVELIRTVATTASWGDRVLAVGSVAALLGCLRRASHEPIVPLPVQLPVPCPDDPSPYARFFGVAPQFDAPHATFTLSSADAARAPVGPDPQTLAFFLQHLQTTLNGREDEPIVGSGADLVDAVAALVVGRLTHPMGAGELARKLGLGERSLQRRLVGAGTSVSAIASLLRLDSARQKLTSSELSVSEIGYALGFEQPASFTRFFKRHSGRTPSEFRARTLGRSDARTLG